MVKKKYLSVLLCVLMSFSVVFAIDAAAPKNSIVAYAAGISAPKASASNSSYKSIKLSWKKVKGAKKYVVSRSAKKSSGYKTVKTINKNSAVSFTDKKVKCGKTYYYKVTAVGASGKKSSKVIKIKCTPAVPSKVKASSPNCAMININYRKVSGATGYEISCSNTKGGKYKKLITTKLTSYTYSPGAGSAVYYKVRAYKSVKGKKIYSPYSKPVKAVAYSHSYVAQRVEPSCAFDGYTTYICEYCLNTYTSDFVPATGTHSFGEYIIDSNPTCISAGNKHTVCSNCGIVHYEMIPATNVHSYGSYVVETSPICAAEGVKYTACADCGYKHYETIPATGEHKYIESVQEATCTAEGKIINTCVFCGKAVTEAIEAKGHTYEKQTVAPKCTVDGYTVNVCKLCGYADESTKVVIKAAGHRYKVTSVKQATCTVNGSKVNTCDVCANAYTEVIPAKGHSYEKKTIAPTCVDKGYTANKCKLCGSVDEASKTNFVPAKGHDFEEKRLEPTCTTEGFFAKICKTCQYVDESTKQDVIPAKGHSYKVTDFKEATCEADGQKVQTCSACGDVIKEIFSAKGHNFADGVNEKGYKVSSCTFCGTATVVDTTCYINLTTGEISVPSVAEYKTTVAGNKKLDLNYDGVSNYEITGNCENMGIDINIPQDGCEVKLAGVSMTNADLDCVNIKNKSADPLIVPVVSISAKADTVNTFTTTVGGNAVDSSCELELKGRGKLVANTVSTSISCAAKLEIKNLTLDITSATNRGIDTKEDILDENGMLTDTEFYNIEVAGNAVITINSADDGIRCKNFETRVLEEGETDSLINISAGALGDGIQLEGKGTNRVPLTLHSGTLNVKGGKSQINNKSNITPIIDGSAVLNLL